MKKTVKKISMLHMLTDIKADYYLSLTKIKAAVALVYAGMSMSSIYSGMHPVVFEDAMLQQTYLHHMNNIKADNSGNNAWMYFRECLEVEILNTGYTSVLGTDDIVEQMALYGTFDEGSVLKQASKVHVSIFQELFSSIDEIFQIQLSPVSINYINITIDENYNLVIENKHV